MILIIDNFDSFVHNLARYVRETDHTVRVVRNDDLSVDACLRLSPRAVILSPGPKRPAEAGVCVKLLRALPPSTPVLGVCLGHQCLVEAFGGDTPRAPRPLHGEASVIEHVGEGVFKGVPSPTTAGRYHSLIAAPQPGSPLIETAWTQEGDVMAVAHAQRPWHGVQFHPESVLTPHGRLMIANFVEMCDSVGQ